MDKELELSYLTRDNVNPRGKARVYFPYHPDDFIYLKHIGDLLLSKQDCAIYYYDYQKQGSPQIAKLAPLLREMQLLVIPVTSNFLFKKCILIQESNLSDKAILRIKTKIEDLANHH